MMLYDVGVATVESARAVRRLALEHPEWVRIVDAALAVASKSKPFGGEFAGTKVLEELKARGGRQEWIPNLRLLVSYQILEKVGDSTRSGRRAYYRFPDPQGVQEALRDIEDLRPVPAPRKLRFLGAGASTSGPRDTARRSPDLPYEPRSWR